MFKIPSFSTETPSTVKTRTVFHDAPESSRATPSIAKSISRDNLLLQSSTARNFNDRDEFRDSTNNNNNNNVVAVRSFDLSEDPSFWKDHNVQVIIRLRPLNSSEISLQGYNRCVRQESSQTITWTGHPESRFTFDVVADETVSQEKLFRVAGVPMVENTVAGYNSCMFAYGQTGSGKTHTMLGDIEGGTRRHSVNCGMTPRVFEYLFTRIQKEKEARREEKFRFTCKCSFLEIYNEHILDLLNPSSSNLQIREDLKKGIYVENLTELEVSSARDVMQQLLEGSMNRKVAATNMNRASSRSHSVFTCVIESTWESQGVTHHRFARLNLVDLAGSERQKSSGAEGERLKEATNINKSLSTLGLVIMNLVSMSNGKSLHVPYRDSKLTFLLQDSLGGNSKTIIIANISPSNGCSLETLSTLKFAQRAKFIKNNAIINEDASGDVLAMRMQIQQLKKEVSQLRSLANGGPGNQDCEAQSLSLLGSPGAFKWEGLNGSFSPLRSDKSQSQKKEYEVALVGALRREKDKDLALQSLTAENKAAMQLAKQREDEIQGLKMRLRFREAGIKRLEAVASGKISAEAHLLKEKEEHLKEIEVLRAQVDRNQEVTRFAMENLRLTEELRRLKSFYEEGEREKMNEQISALQNKLLEALDWKLMHKTDSSDVQESAAPGLSSIKEENEFLQLQAFQHQAEINSLRKKLDSRLGEKEKLDRHIKDLETELKTLRSAEESNDKISTLSSEVPSTLTSDVELKAMVDAIAAASQREAEAHEVAITLSKENDELRAKIKVLVEDNSKLIELYERAVEEKNAKVGLNAENGGNYEAQNMEIDIAPDMEGTEGKQSEDLEHQLAELHEENEKLLSLYETAMQERDDLKRKLSSALHDNSLETGKSFFSEKLAEVDVLEHPHDFDDSIEVSTIKDVDEHIPIAEEDALEEDDIPNLDVRENVVRKTSSKSDEHQSSLAGPSSFEDLHDNQESESSPVCKTMIDETRSVEIDEQNPTFDFLADSEDLTDNGLDGRTSYYSQMEDELVLLRVELEKARENLSNSANYINEFRVLEEAVLKCDIISKEIEAEKDHIKFKQQEIESHKILSSDFRSRRVLIDNKLAAIRATLTSIVSSFAYYEQRVTRAKARIDASASFFHQKKDNLARLQAQSVEISAKKREIQETEAEIRNNLLLLKAKLEEENQRQDNERVLISIDNVQRDEIPSGQSSWRIGSKATELLKSEEQKTKLHNEIKQSREKLGTIKKDVEDLNLKRQKLNNEIQVVSLEMQKAAKIVEETKHALQNVMNEKSALMEVKENGETEIDTLIAEYQHCIFEDCLREEELSILEEDMCTMSIKVDILESERTEIVKRTTQLVFGNECQTDLPSEKMRVELQDVQNLIDEASTIVSRIVR
ncbi:kinesin-like protein KIN-12E [Silene latifolia]|uniref:kinesin-like protein KIN-12E n=1 Tax=Silene latifolia TaxID=37657 RepID=UPI003D7794B8